MKQIKREGWKTNYQEHFKRRLERDRENDSKKIKKMEKAGLFETLEEVSSSEITILSRFIVIIAIVGDLFGLIPLIGNFFSFFFATVLILLYFLNGLGKGFVARKYRKTLRRWLLRGALYLIEIFIPLAGVLPLFTIEALIDYNLSKKGFYKKIKKAEEIINKIN